MCNYFFRVEDSRWWVVLFCCSTAMTLSTWSTELSSWVDEAHIFFALHSVLFFPLSFFFLLSLHIYVSFKWFAFFLTFIYNILRNKKMPCSPSDMALHPIMQLASLLCHSRRSVPLYWVNEYMRHWREGSKYEDPFLWMLHALVIIAFLIIIVLRLNLSAAFGLF